MKPLTNDEIKELLKKHLGRFYSTRLWERSANYSENGQRMSRGWVSQVINGQIRSLRARKILARACRVELKRIPIEVSGGPP